MNYVYNYFGNIILALSIFIGGKIFILKARYRSQPLLRFIIAFATVFTIELGLVFLEPWEKATFFDFPLITSHIIGIWAIAALYFIHDISVPRVLDGICGGLMFYLLCSIPNRAINMFNNKDVSFWWSMLISLSSTLIFGTALGLIIRRFDADCEDFRFTPSMAITSVAFAICVSLLALLEDAAFKFDRLFYLILLFIEGFLAILSLSLELATYAFYQRQLHQTVAEQLSQKEKQNFDTYQDAIRGMNIKIHDLKHQIRQAAEGKKIDKGFLEELDVAIKSYDSFLHTGNETVDLILGEKTLACQKYGIELKAMIDGNSLSFMESFEINSLLGNMLDNAIQAETKETEENKRFISLSSKSYGQYISLRMENYCSKELRFGSNGLPKTDKDPRYHGYGMQSILSIANKYNGGVKASLVDCIFRLDVLLEKPNLE